MLLYEVVGKALCRGTRASLLWPKIRANHEIWVVSQTVEARGKEKESPDRLRHGFEFTYSHFYYQLGIVVYLNYRAIGI